MLAKLFEVRNQQVEMRFLGLGPFSMGAMRVISDKNALSFPLLNGGDHLDSDFPGLKVSPFLGPEWVFVEMGNDDPNQTWDRINCEIASAMAAGVIGFFGGQSSTSKIRLDQAEYLGVIVSQANCELCGGRSGEVISVAFSPEQTKTTFSVCETTQPVSEGVSVEAGWKRCDDHV